MCGSFWQGDGESRERGQEEDEHGRSVIARLGWKVMDMVGPFAVFVCITELASGSRALIQPGFY